jgi:hypothetical protein
MLVVGQQRPKEAGLNPERFSKSRRITDAWIARGLNPVLSPYREPRGFVVTGPAGAPNGRVEQINVLRSAAALQEQQLKHVVRPSAEIGNVVRGTRYSAPIVRLSGISNPILRGGPGAEIRLCESKAAKLRLEGTVPSPPPEVPFRLVPQGEGWYAFETVTHDLEVSREKFVEAVAKYLATVIVDPLITDATELWHTESDPVTETVGALEGVTRRLQIAVDTPLKDFGIGLGLSADQATFAAGVSTELILAPITGPLDKAESYLEVAGIIFGLLTGVHGLVLVCIKLLAHNEGKRLVVRAAVKAFGGSQTDRPRQDRR